MSRKRDYKAEYARRIARGLERGFSRSQARGHPRTNERHVARNVTPPAYNPQLETGLRQLRRGKSLTASAREIGVSPERLRRYLNSAGVIRKRKGRWIPKEDSRSRQMLIFSDGEARTVIVADLETASVIGRYLSAVGEFLNSNDPIHLGPFEGAFVSDVRGRDHYFETRPNVLYRLSSAGAETFEQVYRIVV
jgi:hypothetical protein